MALVKIADFNPDYHESFNENDIKGMSIYIDGDDKIGTVSDVLVDEEGIFRYFVVDLGFWIFGKKVLLPVGRSRLDQNSDRIYAIGMTKEQAENLPEFNDRQEVDHDYEERVRQVYRSTSLDTASSTANTYNPDTYNYQQEPSLYDLNDQDHQTFKLYQERLIATKTRAKTGEVAIGKRIETETARVSVPIEKERVVIERVTPADAGKAVAPGSVNFGEGEVARIEVYEETADIHKEAFVHEEVRIKKVVEQEMVEAQETLRREELDVETNGLPVVEGSDSKLA
ncbi:DUF2382 domain-containing protein [aff. Roholtiella sp. LEGE 12411]|uniref:DUF2382 domain-containing protein n=1 Tax=aff. Roholtiella sp. LEGE 12411 TaxID=1828822 RepID=UPI00187F2867|nr:DUF2382 domain-containing protein [aff. Roholtiella sp. LEGE 12411]